VLTAITRAVSQRISECELTYIGRTPIDVERAIRQHQDYQDLLRRLGAQLVEIPADDTCADCCFLEDTAIVLDELAVIARPSSEVRRLEVGGVKAFVQKHRPTVEVEAPATLEGGDVLRIKRNLFVGLTTRTNVLGVETLRRHAVPLGYSVHEVKVPGALHLKSVCTALDHGTILADSSRLDLSPFANFKIVAVPSDEWMAANILLVNSTVCMPEGFPKTRSMLEKRGLKVATTDISEFLKAEAGLTCMSLLFAA